MPDLPSPQTRAANITKQIPLGQGVENFIKLALPDAAYLPVLRYLTERGTQASTAGEIAGVTCEPKAKVLSALEHFEKLEIARSSIGLLGRKYALFREGAKCDSAQKLVKLWAHPQTHRAVMAIVQRNATKKP